MPNPIPGPDGLKPIVAAIRKAFPDLKYVIENMVVSDDQVAVQTTMHGTHTGDFFGIAPTHKVIKVSQMQIERIANNKIIEHWRVTDELDLIKTIRSNRLIEMPIANLKQGHIYYEQQGSGENLFL